MRIAFVTPEYITEETFDGGLSNYLYRVSIALRDMGHEPVIFVSSNKNNEVIRHKNIEVHRILIDYKNAVQFDDRDFNTAIYWIYQSKLLNKKVEETHKLNPFDIIQYSSWMSTAFFRIQYIPSIVRISSYQKLWDEAYKETTSSRGQKIKQDLEICSLKLTDSIIGPCKNILYHLEKDYNIKGELIESPFIQTVTLNEYDNRVYKKYLGNKNYILFFGTIGILKGCLLISEIIKNLLDEYQDIYFVFVGKNTEYNNKLFIDYIKEKAEKYCDRIIYINKIPHSQLYPIIQQSEFVVLPSLVDNFPNTCIESMAHKKIVIGTLGTGFEQLITNKVNGFLIDKNKPEELLKQIKNVINLNNLEKTKIEEQSYKKICTLTPEKVVNDLINFYENIIINFKPHNKEDNFIINFYNNLLSSFIEELTEINKEYQEIRHKLEESNQKLSETWLANQEAWSKWEETNQRLIDKDKELVEMNKKLSQTWLDGQEAWRRWEETNQRLVEKEKELQELKKKFHQL